MGSGAGEIRQRLGLADGLLAMTDGIKHGLADGSFVKGGKVVTEEVLLVALAVVAEIDLGPEFTSLSNS